MRRLAIIAASLVFLATAHADPGANLLTPGIWQVVKLQPLANDPLKDEDMFMVFLENGVLLTVHAPKGNKQFTHTEVSQYQLANGTLVVSRPNQESSTHSLVQEGRLVRVSVPLGAFWLAPAPNKQPKPTP